MWRRDQCKKKGVLELMVFFVCTSVGELWKCQFCVLLVHRCLKVPSTPLWLANRGRERVMGQDKGDIPTTSVGSLL